MVWNQICLSTGMQMTCTGMNSNNPENLYQQRQLVIDPFVTGGIDTFEGPAWPQYFANVRANLTSLHLQWHVYDFGLLDLVLLVMEHTCELRIKERSFVEARQSMPSRTTLTLAILHYEQLLLQRVNCQACMRQVWNSNGLMLQ